MFIVAPAVPQVITYVNESDTLNLVCSKVMTASGSAITLLGQSWMDPQRNTISNLSTYSLPFVNRTAAGNYTCVTKVVANANGVTNVTASTLVVVYCRCMCLSYLDYHIPLVPIRSSYNSVSKQFCLHGPRSQCAVELHL